jgi:AhpD family alkylhydroperoxidase
MLTLLAGIAFTLPAAAQETTAAATYKDIEATLGSVPTSWKLLPEDAVAAVWAEQKAINSSTTLTAKEKHLIALGVAAQIPCAYCVYGHTAAAKLNGATDAEIKEAVMVAAFVRQMSTVSNGMALDFAEFRKETDATLRFVTERLKAAKP